MTGKDSARGKTVTGRGRWRGRWLNVLMPLVAGTLLSAQACGGGGGSVRDDAGRSAAGREVPEFPAFNADSAFALLERQVAFGPRVPGTAGHAAQLDWMTDYLRQRADTVWLQRFEHEALSGATVPMTNVMARFQPGMTDRILLAAHWDTRPMADQDSDATRKDEPIPGANDGASGVAVLLQLADVLSSHSPPLGVDIILFDGEDYGPGEMYLGARYFASNLPAGYRPLYGILIDMVGDRSPQYLVEPFSQQYAPEVVQRVWDVAEQIGYGNMFLRRNGIAVQDDHIPLNEAGIRTIDIIDFDYPYWHTHDDTVEHTGPEGLGAVGSVLSALVARGG